MGKKQRPKKDDEAALPKFGGFKQLSGLEDFKAKLKEEEASAKKRAAAAEARAPARAPAPSPTPRDRMHERAREDAARAAGAGDDDLSFHRLMAGVVPLDGSGKARVPVTARDTGAKPPRLKADELRAKAEAETAQVLGHLSSLVEDVVRFEVSDDGAHVEGRRADVPPSVLRSLRRGQLPIDARLDLHGLGAEAARERVADFLRDKRARGERCVLVIHGKGSHSPGGGGVLRGEIAAWLSQGRAREHVAAFATARQEDGGDGALYVALRR